MINFEFYITCKVQSSFPFLQMDVWLCQHFLFKRLSLLHWTAFAGTLVKHWQTHSRGVSGSARPAGDEAPVLCGITLPSCSLTSVLMSARVLQLCSCPDHLDDSRSLPLPRGLPLVGAPPIAPTGRRTATAALTAWLTTGAGRGPSQRRTGKARSLRRASLVKVQPLFNVLPFVHVFF